MGNATAAEPLAVPISGKPFHADLMAVDANGQLTFQVGQKQYAMRMADLVCWGQCPEQGRAGGLVLADGSWLAAEVIVADKDALTAESELFGTVKLPLESLSGVVFRASSNHAEGDKLFDRLVGSTGRSDRLLLDNGDELLGQFLSLADATLKFQTDVGPIDVKTDRVTALIFNPVRNRKSSPKENSLEAWAGFSDGSRLLATQLRTEGDSFHITAAGQPLAASQSSLVFLQLFSDRVIYLSDLQPTEYHQTPYLDLPWPYYPDRNVTGGFLRCGGSLHLKGLGVHSAARLEYALDQTYKRFQAELGIDDSTAGRGSVQFRVLVDGRERYASPIIRGGQTPTPISIDIRGAEKLELQVDYADRADVLDHADWLDARLTR